MMEEKEREGLYLLCARKLAEEYPAMMKDYDRMKERLAGSWVYTKEMAIAELSSSTVSYDHVRVQNNRISNPAERIALMMTDEYMRKKQAEYDWERERLRQELNYLDWKMRIVEVAVKERLNDFQQRVFQMIYLKGKTFKETREALQERPCIYKINRTKQIIWHQIIREMQLQEVSKKQYITRLMLEMNRQKGEKTYETDSIMDASRRKQGRNEKNQAHVQAV